MPMHSRQIVAALTKTVLASFRQMPANTKATARNNSAVENALCLSKYVHPLSRLLEEISKTRSDIRYSPSFSFVFGFHFLNGVFRDVLSAKVHGVEF